MTGTLLKIKPRLTVSLSALAIAASLSAEAASDDLVFIFGVSTDTPIHFTQMQGRTNSGSLEQACQMVNSYLWTGASAAPPSISHHLFGDEGIGGALPMLDCSEAEPTTNRAVIAYSTCSMTMTDGIHTMSWTVPPGAPEAQMVIINAQTEEFIEGAFLETELSQVRDFAKGDELSQTVTPLPGQSKEYEIGLEIGPTGPMGNYSISTETYTGKAYKFDYEGQISLPGMEAMGSLVPKIESEGTAWLAREVPGSDVVATFYENFKNYVTPATGAGTLMTAMIEQMADVVEHGMPLETTQTVKSTMPFGGLAEGSTSTSNVIGVAVWKGAAAEYDVCGHREAPEGYTTVTMAEMSGMPAGGSGPSAEDMREMEDAMQQYNEAMQDMTPEQRQAMQQFGMGDMMQQIMGGADPAAQAASGGAAAGAAAAGAAGGKTGGSTMPPSEELNAGNLTESVQRHLQALGYDVGDIDGEASMETTIAISTFQAEKGMEVTGEVSPQLLGVLSAEVDSRR